MKPDIKVTIFNEFIPMDGYPKNWTGEQLVGVYNNFHLPLEEEWIEMVMEPIVDITPIKYDRWHNIYLKYDKGSGDYSQPHFFEIVHIELVPEVCIQCGKGIKELEYEAMALAGIEPLCSQYCSEKWNGNYNPQSDLNSISTAL